MNNKTKLIVAAAAAATAALPVLIAAPKKPTELQKFPFWGKNFAHRGLHTRDKSVPENSLEAFRLASEAGYGIELDVQLSKDGYVVVFHDDTLNRVCGVDSRVDEKTLDELQELRLCDSEYTIPLFSEVLEVIDGRGPLIVELKNGKRNKELCEKTYALLKNYKGDVCVESFNPFIVAWFKKNAKEMLRGQLAAPIEEYKDMPKIQGFILSNTLLNFLARPNFIAYKIGKRPFMVRLSEKLGAMRVGWTSHDPSSEKDRDAVIFEFYKPQLKYK